MNFTREKNSELYLGTTTMNFTYISEKMNFTWEHVLRLLKMILGSRPVNLVWSHFPWTFGQSYLTETVFFLDSTRHLNLHEMPHLIIKCSQLVILSTCFFWNSMSLLVKNIRTIQGYLRLSFLRLMYSNAVQIAKTYENYLELSWKQGLMHFDIYVVVSRIDSCFFWGGHNTFFLYTRPSGNPFWISYELLVNFYDILLYCFKEIFMQVLCISYAVLMHFWCNSYAFLMQFLCISYAILMRFLCSSYAVLKLHTLLPKTYEAVKTA